MAFSKLFVLLCVFGVFGLIAMIALSFRLSGRGEPKDPRTRDLEAIADLKRRGALNEEEYEKAKKRILGG